MCNNKTLSAEISVLTRHKETATHIDNAKKFSCSTSRKTQQSIVSAFQNRPQTLFENDMTKISTIKLAAFVAEHRISSNTMNHLTDLLPQLCPDSKIAKNIKLKRTKVQAVINNCIGASEKQSLIKDLTIQKFSILIDESTDISVIKTVAVVVRYFDSNLGQVISRFWDLIQLFDASTTDHSANAEKLFTIVVDSFQKHSIPLENIIGFGSDGANTMIGCRNSVASRFRNLCPGIIILKCICHSLHLCANDATKELPYTCEKLARNIYNYFKTSSKRQSEFVAFQQFAEVEVHRILRPAQTRWLSLNAVIDRILEQWDALRLYFDAKWLTDSECQEIHTHLNDPVIKAYYYFLGWMLPKFTAVNSYFQSESVVITKLNIKMTALYRELIQLIFPVSYINSIAIEAIDPTEEKNHKELKDIYLGLGVQKQLELIKEDRKEIFRQKCKQFIIKACTGIRKRYSINDTIMTAISNFDPVTCVSEERLESLAPIFTLLPRLIPETLNEQQELDDEWRRLLIHLPKDLDASQHPPDKFWHQVAQITIDNRKVFKQLPSFMLGMLSLPHSNAECERIFSKVNDIKTKKRNKLITRSIKGNLLTQQSIKRHGQNCINFNPDQEMLKKLNKNIYENEELLVSDSD
ncbi:uncharacterized protein LOC113239503 [Hyposmocoma kahamanoa]|uniref:uncharacterized protein LOC113239503 n=1 Tax=Hyposmocoma kahamanoa TaxID=1477025 RepID=UPI000E6D912E|nr:uncharacterized protein LOC113239503 [Hyposmocoma kahamanoa]